jgi:putative oxidoreductase
MGDVMDNAAPYLRLAGRILLSVIFIQAGISKIFGYEDTAQHMTENGVPAILLPLVILTEAGGGFLILLGLWTRWAALALAGFCVLAGIPRSTTNRAT